MSRTSTRNRNQSQRAIEAAETERALQRAKERSKLDIEKSITSNDLSKVKSKYVKRGNKSKGKKKNVWCSCQSKSEEEDGRAMIECLGGCDDWYHLDCIDMNENQAEELHEYICSACEKLTGKKSIMKFDISTFPSPSPPPGFIKSVPRKRKYGTKQNHVEDVESSSDTSSDSASDAEIESQSDAEDKPVKSPRIIKKPRLSASQSTITKRGSLDRKTSISSASRKGSVSVAPARLHVQKKLNDVLVPLFLGVEGDVDVESLATEVEACIWEEFKEAVGGSETIGSKYRTQFNLLFLSLPRARDELKQSIVTRQVTPAQIARFTPLELASTERLEEIEKAKENSLQQSVRAREDISGIRFVRDVGFERVEDTREHEIQALQRAEQEIRQKERDENKIHGQNKADDDVVVSHTPRNRPTPVVVASRSTSMDVLHTPTLHSTPNLVSTFALKSAWGGDDDYDRDHEVHDESMAHDQSEIDLSDIRPMEDENLEKGDEAIGDGVSDMEMDMEVEMDQEDKIMGHKKSEMELFKDKPIVWSGGIVNPDPSNSSPHTPKMQARLSTSTKVNLIGSTNYWSNLLPKDPIEITGRVPIQHSIKFLSETRLSPFKELIPVIFTLDSNASDEERTRWIDLIEFHLIKDRHAMYRPYGNKPIPPGAAKELYLIPIRPQDPPPEFTSMLDGFDMPTERFESIFLGLFIVNKDTTARSLPLPPPPLDHPPPPSVQHRISTQDKGLSPIPPPPLPPTNDLQAMLASLNPAIFQNISSNIGSSPHQSQQDQQSPNLHPISSQGYGYSSRNPPIMPPFPPTGTPIQHYQNVNLNQNQPEWQNRNHLSFDTNLDTGTKQDDNQYHHHDRYRPIHIDRWVNPQNDQRHVQDPYDNERIQHQHENPQRDPYENEHQQVTDRNKDRYW